jgi:hypothetical protein
VGQHGFSKIFRRLGVQKHFPFLKGTCSKTYWRLISDTSLWTLVIAQKYISPNSIEDWIRSPLKASTNGSIIWKVMISSFPVVGDNLAWKVGKGNQLRIGTDPWPRSGNSHILPKDLI